VADVKEGDLWYFPTGLPHSLQGLGPDGAEFVLAFDNGVSLEFNTLLATDWMAHTPPEVLAIRPGAMRKMHWHPNADEWQYYLKGTGRMTVFNAGPSEYRELPSWRHRLCAGAWPLHREDREHRTGTRRGVPLAAL
jgi:quercetin dioxygenase-like cupin family protein